MLALSYLFLLLKEYHCEILMKCHNRQLNLGSFVWHYFALIAFGVVFVCIFSCTFLFVGISRVIGCEYHLQNDLTLTLSFVAHLWLSSQIAE